MLAVLEQQCDELYRAAQARDPQGFLAAVDALCKSAQGVPAGELTGVLTRVGGVFAQVPLGLGARLALLGGALVEDGADPGPLVAPVVAGTCGALARCAQFVAVWRRLAGEDVELPDPDGDAAAVERTIGVLSGPSGLPGPEAYGLAESWFAADGWVRAACTLLTAESVRAGLLRREELTAAAAALSPLRADVRCLAGLLAILDAEPVLVLHRPTGRGYEVTVDGVGDVGTLHALLAGAVAGDVSARFDLTGADGGALADDGRAADVPLLDGRRVVVLDAPADGRDRDLARDLSAVHASVRMDRHLPAAEAAGWLAKVAPAAARG
jgi:hypothetical protein